VDWTSPVPMSADDGTGTSWQVRRAWPDETPGEYVLEVLTPGRPGVRGAHLRHGHFELIPLDDPGLPALRVEAQQGEVISYLPYKRAVIRAEGRYIKIYRPGRATVAAERCAQMDILLDAGTFTTPRILRQSPQDVIVFSAIPGPTLNELGEDDSTTGDEAFAWAWEKWSHAWVAQLNGPYGPAAQNVLDSLPLHSAEVEAAGLWRCVHRWVRHNKSVPELSPQRKAMRARAEEMTKNLLRSAPDPLVWAHGDLHDKQIIATDSDAPPGLLDFDSTARAEAARDLAKLDVRLELQLRQNRMTPARYLTAHSQVLAAAGELHVSPGRFHAYSEAIWLHLASSPLPGRLSVANAVLADRAAAQDQGTAAVGQTRQVSAGDFPWPTITAPRRFRYSFSPLLFSEMAAGWSELWMCVLRIFPDLPLF
jgi:hypothetical protein